MDGSIYQFILPSIHPSIHQLIPNHFIPPSIHPSIHQYFTLPSIPPSIHISSIHPLIPLFIYPSLQVSFYPLFFPPILELFASRPHILSLFSHLFLRTCLLGPLSMSLSHAITDFRLLRLSLYVGCPIIGLFLSLIQMPLSSTSWGCVEED